MISNGSRHCSNSGNWRLIGVLLGDMELFVAPVAFPASREPDAVAHTW